MRTVCKNVATLIFWLQKRQAMFDSEESCRISFGCFCVVFVQLVCGLMYCFDYLLVNIVLPCGFFVSEEGSHNKRKLVTIFIFILKLVHSTRRSGFRNNKGNFYNMEFITHFFPRVLEYELNIHIKLYMDCRHPVGLGSGSPNPDNWRPNRDSNPGPLG